MKPSLIIIGLGNTGKQYVDTRHNVGFWAAEKLGETFGTNNWQLKQKFLSDVMEGRIITMPILLVKPTTYMNNSGNAIRKFVDFFKLDSAKQLLIICDDIDLPAGEMRLRESGGPGSHNGLRSVVDQIGEDFLRLRIGVLGEHAPQGSFKNAGEDLSNYVLSSPSTEDKEKIVDAIGKIPDVVQEYATGSKSTDV